LKNFVSYRSDFIMDGLFNFEPVKRFKNWRYMSEFESFRDERGCDGACSGKVESVSNPSKISKVTHRARF